MHSPAGLGAIYVYNQYTSSLEGTTITIPNVGTIPSNADRGLSGNTTKSHDPDAFYKVGKVGLGDIDVDTENSILYVVNLNDRQIYSVDLTATSPTATALSTSYPMPTCTNGDFRPWALNFTNNKLYLGGVCSGEAETDTKAQGNLKAAVLALDVTTNNWSTVLDFDLDYPRESPKWSNDQGWYPWISDFSTPNPRSLFWWPTPILSDIEFADDGHMILGFADRSGMQYGARNYGLTAAATTQYYIISGGDILKATPSGQNFTIEPNSYITTTTPKLTDEFYGGEEFGDHYETSNGGIAVQEGSNEVILGGIDPVRVDSNGVYWLSTTDGTKQDTRQLTVGDTYGAKSAGIGDIEIITCPPVPPPDVELTKTVNNSQPMRGDTVIYTLTVTNAGIGNASGVIAQDNLPIEVEYISDDSGGDYSNTTGFWTVGSVPAGESRTLNITVKIR